MTLPFRPRPHRVVVDDVKPVELINAAHQGTNDFLEAFGVGHHSDGRWVGEHRHAVVPIANALIVFPPDPDDLRADPDSLTIRAWGRWQVEPTWQPAPARFDARVPGTPVGVRTFAQATNTAYDFGARAFISQFVGDTLIHVQLVASPLGVGSIAWESLRLLFIEVYGEL